MVQKIKAFISLLLVSIMLFSFVPGTVAFALQGSNATPTDAAEEVSYDPAEEITEIIITAPTREVERGGELQLTANVSGATWESSDEKVATVDSNGLVKGKKVGRSLITATKGNLTGSFEVCVTIRNTSGILNYLSNNSILSYKYSYVDNYFYIDAPNAWQRNYGYSAFYDIIAPYILLEYDYVRVHFEYEGKDWLLQLWKGQYGMVFYGAEVGLYNKAHSDSDDTLLTFYKCAPEEDWIGMQTTLYRKYPIGSDYIYQFATDPENTWWSTGFIPGHLVVEEPAAELRQTGTLTFKDVEMAEAFARGLAECGFARVRNTQNPNIDSFCVDGCDVRYSWQNISEAENTMQIKVTGATLILLNLGLLLAVGSLLGMGLLAFLIFI